MIKKTILASALVLLGAWCGLRSFAQPAPATPSATPGATADVVAAAKKFLETLDDAQRGKLIFDFNDKAQRARWSNLPQGAVQRAGLRMGDLTPAQRDAAMKVVEAALSKQGYEKVLQIVAADETLRGGDGGRGGMMGRGPPDRGGMMGPGDRGPPDRGGMMGPGDRGPPDRGGMMMGRGRGGPGGGANFGRDLYFISFLGQPSATEPWMIQFGGHHLGINITLAGDHGTLAPSHTGAQPATYQLEGKTVRPLGREVDKAFDLLSSLDEAQKKKAILGFQIRDLVLGPGRDGQTIQPEGIKGSDLTEKQHAMLMDLASEWTGILHDAAATAKMDEMKKSLADTWFAWSGPIEKGAAAYFRIQGPAVFIEFAPQRMGGDAGNHIHTIYRDPKNDYGTTWWKP